MQMLETIAWWLVIIGAINWGTTGLGFNLVEALVSGISGATQIVYILVGLSGIYLLFNKLTGKK